MMTCARGGLTLGFIRHGSGISAAVAMKAEVNDGLACEGAQKWAGKPTDR